MIDLVKDAFQKEKLIANLRFFALLNAGLILTALGIVWFKTPNHFAFGGTSGLSVLLAAMFPQFNVGFFMWVLNLVLVALGFLFLGISCMGWTVFSSIALSFYVSVCEAIWPMPAPFTDDTLLELIFAVLLPAVGAAIVFNIGASTGGTDIVAMILTRHSSLNIGSALMASDILIVCGAAAIFGVSSGLYSFLGLIGKSFVVDGVIESINQRKVCTVVTSNPEDVTRRHDGAHPPGGHPAAQLPAAERQSRLHHHRQLQRDHRQGLPRRIKVILIPAKAVRKGGFFAVLTRNPPPPGANLPVLAVVKSPGIWYNRAVRDSGGPRPLSREKGVFFDDYIQAFQRGQGARDLRRGRRPGHGRHRPHLGV